MGSRRKSSQEKHRIYDALYHLSGEALPPPPANAAELARHPCGAVRPPYPLRRHCGPSGPPAAAKWVPPPPRGGGGPAHLLGKPVKKAGPRRER